MPYKSCPPRYSRSVIVLVLACFGLSVPVDARSTEASATCGIAGNHFDVSGNNGDTRGGYPAEGIQDNIIDHNTSFCAATVRGSFAGARSESVASNLAEVGRPAVVTATAPQLVVVVRQVLANGRVTVDPPGSAVPILDRVAGKDCLAGRYGNYYGGYFAKYADQDVNVELGLLDHGDPAARDTGGIMPPYHNRLAWLLVLKDVPNEVPYRGPRGSTPDNIDGPVDVVLACDAMSGRFLFGISGPSNETLAQQPESPSVHR